MTGIRVARGRSGTTPSPGHGVPWGRWVLLLTAGAVAYRLLLLLGRGDYLAFDEGWYLLLGRSLFHGEGYSLVGLPHTTLSPLFPILAGGAGSLLGSWVWGGRIVAALSSGLLLLPLWGIFRRLTSPRIAFSALALVAVLPSMSPFTVPFFIGTELWVGAEPLLHLFLFSGIFLFLKAIEGEGRLSWLLTGVAFGLGFLARPEAVVAWGLLGLVTLGSAAWRRSNRRLVGAALMGAGFLTVGAPYWGYLHSVTGEWSLTGRGINAAANAAKVVAGARRGGSSATIEGMLWADDEAYVQRLYGLDDSGRRLRSDYWGVYPPSTEPPPASEGERPPSGETPRGATAQAAPARAIPSLPLLYVRAMKTVFPSLLWLLVLPGLLHRRSPGWLRKEAPVAMSLAGTSAAIALLVAVDPRTQLFLAPILALYAAEGIALLEEILGPRLRRFTSRPRFLENLLVLLTITGLLAVGLNRLFLALTYGSPHHIVAAQNRQVAQELVTRPETAEGPVASWHPGIAVHADRDWRVLPYADLGRIIRFAGTSGARVAVLSAYYPPFRGELILGTRYLVLPIPEEAVEGGEWEIEPLEGDSIRGFGRLRVRE